MTLIVLAVVFCVFGIAALFWELKLGVKGAFKNPRFLFEVAALLTGFLIFYFSYREQQRASRDQQRDNTEKAVTAAKQAAELEKMQIKSDHILQTQGLQFEKQALQLEKQEAQLEGAKRQAEGQKRQLALQNRQIEISTRLIEAQRRLTLNHNLSGIELSFTPSPQQWTKIATEYHLIKSPEKDVSYVDAIMIAERDGDHWRIDFEPVEVKKRVVETPTGPIKIGGNKKFHKLSTFDLNNRVFEDVIREASLGLRIEWGNGTNTAIEPRQDDYPSAIYISHHKIGLIFRPPLVLWNLNELRNNAIVTFYGRDYPIPLPASFTIRSLDPAVILNQTIQLNWKDREKSLTPTYEMQMNRQMSGPHTLSVDFNFFGPLAGKPYITSR